MRSPPTSFLAMCLALALVGCGSETNTYLVQDDGPASQQATPMVGDELVDAPPARCAELRAELENLTDDLGDSFDQVLAKKAEYDAGLVDDLTEFDDAWLEEVEITKWQLNTMETCPEFTTARAVAIRTWRDIGKFENAFVAQTQTSDPLASIPAEQVSRNIDELRRLLGLGPRGAS